MLSKVPMSPEEVSLNDVHRGNKDDRKQADFHAADADVRTINRAKREAKACLPLVVAGCLCDRDFKDGGAERFFLAMFQHATPLYDQPDCLPVCLNLLMGFPVFGSFERFCRFFDVWSKKDPTRSLSRYLRLEAGVVTRLHKLSISGANSIRGWPAGVFVRLKPVAYLTRQDCLELKQGDWSCLFGLTTARRLLCVWDHVRLNPRKVLVRRLHCTVLAWQQTGANQSAECAIYDVSFCAPFARSVNVEAYEEYVKYMQGATIYVLQLCNRKKQLAEDKASRKRQRSEPS